MIQLQINYKIFLFQYLKEHPIIEYNRPPHPRQLLFRPGRKQRREQNPNHAVWSLSDPLKIILLDGSNNSSKFK